MEYRGLDPSVLCIQLLGRYKDKNVAKHSKISCHFMQLKSGRRNFI
jgi:hypothetical protein